MIKSVNQNTITYYDTKDVDGSSPHSTAFQAVVTQEDDEFPTVALVITFVDDDGMGQEVMVGDFDIEALYLMIAFVRQEVERLAEEDED